VYAVVESGGKQFKVSEGQSLEVEKLPYEVGERVELDRVFLISGDTGVQVGQPTVKGAKVLATVTYQGKRRKIFVFKYRPKERYRRRAGHRQSFTRLRIDEIVV
jgi:large subunit ribosomal protein L21